MITQEYYLDMIPGESTAPMVHVSQFDVNSRTLTFNLMKGGVAYEPDAGMSVTLDGTKPDNTAFSYPMTVNGSSVSINVQTQMTVVSGHVKCEVSVSNVSGKIGSANFILAVEEAAIDDDAISETDIPIFEDLKNQAQQAAASAQQSASAVSSIVPASAGTTGQVLTKTATGADWQDVDGLPAGGTTGQVLTKQSSTDGDADWETPTGVQWGDITGTLSDQTDLQTALDAKADASTLATVETGTTSSKAYAVGEYLVYNGILYKVTTAITSSGQTLTPGSNITAVNVGAELTSLNNGLTPKVVSLSASEMTLPAGVTLYRLNYLTIIGKIVILNFSIKMTSVSGQQSIANFIPNAYKPANTTNGTAETGLGDGKCQPVTISPDGSMSFFPVNKGTTYAIGSFVYAME